MTNIAAEKSRIRKSLLERRNKLSSSEIYEKSQFIQLHVLNSQQFLKSDTVGVYLPIGTEVRTEEIIRNAIGTGKKVALPKIESEKIKFYQLYDKIFNEEELVLGKLGVKEPLKIGKGVNRIDLLIVPGIGFDIQGSRIGYGRGYFDEYLRRAKVSFSLGLGYEFQLVSYKLPRTPLDQAIDALSIETRLVDFKFKS
ncbi:MAG TPA: 5-formyltetrahydrofolate cyclo-ligase, partial [Nitrososphaeraceae archaeon]|nr:5-formyltetrahydrofolate cyclo-ligase [Nitrososphaeraceae archaeon]